MKASEFGGVRASVIEARLSRPTVGGKPDPHRTVHYFKGLAGEEASFKRLPSVLLLSSSQEDVPSVNHPARIWERAEVVGWHLPYDSLSVANFRKSCSSRVS